MEWDVLTKDSSGTRPESIGKASYRLHSWTCKDFFVSPFTTIVKTGTSTGGNETNTTPLLAVLIIYRYLTVKYFMEGGTGGGKKNSTNLLWNLEKQFVVFTDETNERLLGVVTGIPNRRTRDLTLNPWHKTTSSQVGDNNYGRLGGRYFTLIILLDETFHFSSLFKKGSKISL